MIDGKPIYSHTIRESDICAVSSLHGKNKSVEKPLINYDSEEAMNPLVINYGVGRVEGAKALDQMCFDSQNCHENTEFLSVK